MSDEEKDGSTISQVVQQYTQRGSGSSGLDTRKITKILDPPLYPTFYSAFTAYNYNSIEIKTVLKFLLLLLNNFHFREVGTSTYIVGEKLPQNFVAVDIILQYGRV